MSPKKSTATNTQGAELDLKQMSLTKGHSRRTRFELQAKLIIDEISPVIDCFQSKNGKKISFDFEEKIEGFGYAAHWSGLGFQQGNNMLFEVEKYEHHYGWSDSECCNIDDRWYSLHAVGAETSLGRLEIAVGAALHTTFHLSREFITPQILKDAPHVLNIHDDTSLSFAFNDGNESFTMKLSDLSGKTKTSLNQAVTSLISVWEKVGERIEKQKARAKVRQEAKEEKAAMEKEAHQLEQLKKKLRKK